MVLNGIVVCVYCCDVTSELSLEDILLEGKKRKRGIMSSYTVMALVAAASASVLELPVHIQNTYVCPPSASHSSWVMK